MLGFELGGNFSEWLDMRSRTCCWYLVSCGSIESMHWSFLNLLVNPVADLYAHKCICWKYSFGIEKKSGRLKHISAGLSKYRKKIKNANQEIFETEFWNFDL